MVKWAIRTFRELSGKQKGVKSFSTPFMISGKRPTKLSDTVFGPNTVDITVRSKQRHTIELGNVMMTLHIERFLGSRTLAERPQTSSLL